MLTKIVLLTSVKRFIWGSLTGNCRNRNWKSPIWRLNCSTPSLFQNVVNKAFYHLSANLRLRNKSVPVSEVQTLCTSLRSHRMFLLSLRGLGMFRVEKVIRWQLLTLLEFGESLRSKDHLTYLVRHLFRPIQELHRIILYNYPILKGYFKVI